MQWNPFKRYSIADVQSSQTTLISNKPIMEKRSLAKIAIIDDEGFPPIDNLNDSGFCLYFIGNINDIRKIEEFPIVLCDIKGVALKFSQSEQGAALISEIKRHYPEKVIIVYTGSSTRSSLVKGAINESDNYIPKSADIDQWVKVLDKAIDNAFDPVEQWKRIRGKLVECSVPAKSVANIEHKFAKSIINGNANTFSDYVKKLKISDDVKPILQNLASSAIWAALTV
jgi:hypothetical protein